MPSSPIEPQPAVSEQTLTVPQTPGRMLCFQRLQRILAVAGIVIAAPFFAWLVLGMLESVPSMVDVFGMTGLRIPASITICGLLMSAIGFYEP